MIRLKEGRESPMAGVDLPDIAIGAYDHEESDEGEVEGLLAPRGRDEDWQQLQQSPQKDLFQCRIGQVLAATDAKSRQNKRNSADEPGQCPHSLSPSAPSQLNRFSLQASLAAGSGSVCTPRLPARKFTNQYDKGSETTSIDYSILQRNLRILY